MGQEETSLQIFLTNGLDQNYLPSPKMDIFSAIVSANSNDDSHPKKATIRALVHRGANVVKTEGTIQC